MWVLLLQTFVLLLVAFLAGAALACFYKRTLDSILTRPYPNEDWYLTAPAVEAEQIVGTEQAAVIERVALSNATVQHGTVAEQRSDAGPALVRQEVPARLARGFAVPRSLEGVIALRRMAVWTFWLSLAVLLALAGVAYFEGWFPTDVTGLPYKFSW